jgi:signal transduction protein with GAF and PtsI domain
MVAPMLAHRELLGVICVESSEPGVFQASDECAFGILANQVAMALATHRTTERPIMAEVQPSAGRSLQVKHYREDDSIFVDNEYLIKGVAGGILWKLLHQYQAENRSEFSNKEIRLDQSLELPDIKDNLEARLILLRKRLEERCEHVRIERVARGRFRLVVNRPLALQEASGGGPL